MTRAPGETRLALGCALALCAACTSSTGAGLRSGDYAQARREAQSVSSSLLSDERLVDRPLIQVFQNSALRPAERVELLRILIQRGAAVNALDRAGDTALLAAARNGEADAAALLLDHGASIDSVNRAGESAFSIALARNDTRMVELLAQRGATRDTRNANDEPPLYLAALTGDRAEVERLLELGAPLEVRGLTALMGACAGGHEQLVRQLVERRGAEVATTNGYGENAVTFAAEGGNQAVFEYLLERGAAFRLGRRTPLMAAAAAGRAQIVERLLELGVPPDEAPAGESPAIAHAAVRSSEAVVCRLLAAGARVPELALDDVSLRAAGLDTLARCLILAGREDEALTCLERSGADYDAAAADFERAAESFEDQARSAAMSRFFIALAAGALPALQRDQARGEAKQLAQVAALRHASERGAGLAGYYAAYDPERAMGLITGGAMSYGAPIGAASTWSRGGLPTGSSYSALAGEARKLASELRERAGAQRARANELRARRR